MGRIVPRQHPLGQRRRLRTVDSVGYVDAARAGEALQDTESSAALLSLPAPTWAALFATLR